MAASSAATLPGTPGKYLIQAKLWDGSTIEFEDPYRFGPLITDSSCTCTPKARTTKPIACWARTWPRPMA